MQCPQCQHENREHAKFCEACAAPLAQVCPSCGRELRPTAKFCDECGALLAESPRSHPYFTTKTSHPSTSSGQAQHESRRDPRSYTPKHLAQKILTSRSALEGERKQVTVLFADVKGSMELAGQVDAEEWHGIMDRFFAILSEGVHRFEGTVNQYTGDGIMALFGAPIAHEDHAQRACWAALYLRDELRRYADDVRRSHGLSFSVRMGLNSGGVVVGRIGDDLRMDYTAQGHVVGLAARMQDVAEPGRVYLTANTRDLVSGYFELRDLGSLRVKGLQEPLPAFELERAGRLRTRLDLSRARGFTRFVGRGHEMKRLDTVLAQALEGKGQVVGVVGEAGVGKSRLCLEFVEGCRAQGVAIYEAHCPAHGKSIPFLPVFELFRSYFGISELDGPVEARRKIAGTLILLDESFQRTLPLVFDFLSVPDPERPAPSMDPDARQRQLLAFVRRLIEARSKQEPAVMLVDDLHWVDAGSDAFVAQAVEATAGTRTLLLTNFRPEYDAQWMNRSHYQQVSLLPLTAEAVSELLDDLLGRDPSLAGLREKIQERTGGNPFFVEEIFQSLVETGGLQGNRGAYRLAEPIGKLALPATVETVLAARIDRLAEREKEVLQIASVIGREIPELILRSVVQMPGSELAAALAILTAAEFLHEKALYPEAEYAFKHQLTQEVAYSSQLTERRRSVHAAVARAIEELRPGKLDEEAALLAHHSELAGNVFEAARWHRRAALWIGVSDAGESVRHWRRVHELCESMTDSEEAAGLALEACFRILMIGWRVGLAHEEIDHVFESGMRLAEAMQDVRARARLLDGYATAWGVVSWDWEGVVPYINQAIELAESADDRGLILALQQRLCWTLMMIGKYQESVDVADRALQWSAGDVKLGADVIGWSPYLLIVCTRAYSLMVLGRLEEAAQELDRAWELGRRGNEAEVLWWAKWYTAALAAVKGEAAAFLGHARQVVEMAERLGNPIFRGISYGQLAIALASNGEWDAAVEAAGRWKEHEVAGAGIEQSATALSRAHLGRGDLAKARTAMQEALIAADRMSGMKNTEIITRMNCAELMAEIDGAAQKAAVERELQTVQAFVEDTGAVWLVPRIHETRARLARLLGDQDEYESKLREAHRLYSEMGATGHAERLAKELKESQQ